MRIIFQVTQWGAILGNQLNYNPNIDRLKFQNAPRQTRFKVEKVNTLFARLKWHSVLGTAEVVIFQYKSFYNLFSGLKQ